jgi:malonate transporter MadL subunit
MKIYGIAFLAACYLVGQWVGEILGRSVGLSGNVGGVGIGMLLMILLSDPLKKRKLLPIESELGILFWSSMYIPVVVAMSAIQNVHAAVKGGWVALAVGVLVTMLMLFLVPILSPRSNSNPYERVV